MFRAWPSTHWVPKALTVVLYLQAGLAGLVGLASVLGMSGFAHTAADGRRLGVGFWAFAIMLVMVVIPQISGNRGLFIVPLAWTAFHLADSLIELLVMGDAAFIPPVIIELAFLITYSVFFRALQTQTGAV